MRTAFVVAVSAILLAGCSAPTTPSSPPPQCPSPPHITIADNGNTVCIPTDATIEVQLPANGNSHWSLPVSDSDAVQQYLITGTAPPPGIDQSYLKAAHKGTARLTASRPACPPPQPSTVSCKSIVSFSVTINVV